MKHFSSVLSPTLFKEKGVEFIGYTVVLFQSTALAQTRSGVRLPGFVQTIVIDLRVVRASKPMLNIILYVHS